MIRWSARSFGQPGVLRQNKCYGRVDADTGIPFGCYPRICSERRNGPGAPGIDLTVPAGISSPLWGLPARERVCLNLLGCLDRPTAGKILSGKTMLPNWTTLPFPKSAAPDRVRLSVVYLIQQLTVIENIEVPLFYQRNVTPVPASDASNLPRWSGWGSTLPPSDANLRRPATTRGDRPVFGEQSLLHPRRRTDGEP